MTPTLYRASEPIRWFTSPLGHPRSPDRLWRNSFYRSPFFMAATPLDVLAARASSARRRCARFLLANADRRSAAELVCGRLARHQPIGPDAASASLWPLRGPAPRRPRQPAAAQVTVAPSWLMLPSRSLPPLEFWRGRQARKAANSRPLAKGPRILTVATIAEAVIGRFPAGSVNHRRAGGRQSSPAP